MSFVGSDCNDTSFAVDKQIANFALEKRKEQQQRRQDGDVGSGSSGSSATTPTLAPMKNPKAATENDIRKLTHRRTQSARGQRPLLAHQQDPAPLVAPPRRRSVGNLDPSHLPRSQSNKVQYARSTRASSQSTTMEEMARTLSLNDFNLIRTIGKGTFGKVTNHAVALSVFSRPHWACATTGA